MATGFRNMVLRKAAHEIFSKYNVVGSQFINRSYASMVKKLERKLSKIEAARVASESKRIDSTAESLAAKGFMRSTKPYSPPDNVSERIKNIFASFKLPTTSGYSFNGLEDKFKVLNECFKDFKHSIPNSELYEMRTIDDIIKFYETPVDKTIPLDAMRNQQLPENLHIQYDYVRFHPETDTMFGGQTAFPKSSTLVTGLKYRDKYPGHIAKRSWP